MRCILQLFYWSLGILSFVRAFLDPRFRDAEGFLNGGFCLSVSIGLAFIILGFTVTTRWRRSAFWFSLALVGQAVALQLIEAGPYVRYQHYKPFGRLLIETHPLLLIYLAVQTVLVAAGLRILWPNILAWIGRTFKTWQLIGVGMVFFLSSATVSREIPVYVAELFFATFIQGMNLGNIVLIVWALPEEVLVTLRKRFDNFGGWIGEEHIKEPRGIDRFSVLAAGWVTVLAILLCFFSYERHPHIPDEVGYLYHARYFAEGMFAMPAPPVPDSFKIDLMTYEENRWYSPLPPGWPAMLTLGILFGAPWLLNPMLAGLNILFVYIFIREIYDRRTARVSVLLLCISPWYIFMAMNFMGHTFTLTCALIASLAVSWARKSGKALWGWVSGIATGMVSLIRPLDGLVVATLLGLWAIGIGGKRLKTSILIGLILGSVIIGSAALPYNKMFTGDPAKSPLMVYFDKYYGPGKNALGFGPERGLGWAIDPFPGHSPIDALVNADLNIFSINIELFGWSTGSLIMIALMLFSGTMRREDYFMLIVVAAISGAYSFYWFSGGPDFGARYWYLMLVPLVVLTARGIQFLEGTVVRTPVVMAAVLSLCFFTLVNYFPWRAIDKYHHYRGMRPDIRYLRKEYNFEKSLVLIRGDQQPDYASAVIYNPLDLYTDMPVYAWDKNSKVRAELLKVYQDRSIWIVNGPTITHGPFKVIAGPLSTQELLSKSE